MKKLLLYCILLITGSLQVYSQLLAPFYDVYEEGDSLKSSLMASSGLFSDMVPNLIPPSPKSQLFERVYLDHPVTEYHGLPEISIPLGEITIKGLSIPISLNYHAGGLRFLQYDGDIGAGWTLNIDGFGITRTIHGKDDFEFINRPDANASVLSLDQNDSSLTIYQQRWKRDQYLSRIWWHPDNSGGTGLGQILSGQDTVKANYMDGEFDQFTYNLPNEAGHFIIEGDGRYFTGVVLEGGHTRVLMQKTWATITDGNGNKYNFGDGNSREYALIKQGRTRYLETGWGLSKITSPHGETIEFTYRNDTLLNSRIDNSYWEAASFMCAPQTCFFRRQYGIVDGYVQMAPLRQSRSIQDPTIISLLEKVVTTELIIEINRRETGDNSGNSVALIDNIIIRDNNPNPTLFYRKIEFKQSHFPSFPSTYQPWHYLLESIVFKDIEGNIEKKYKFDYYKNNNILRGRSYPDQWGFYKGLSNSELNFHEELQKILYIKEHHPFLAGMFNKIDRINHDIFRDRTTSTRECLEQFTLKSITHPTGGKTEYIYEPHQYYDSLSRKVVTGGGLRISKINNYESSQDTEPLQTIYEYPIGVANFQVNEHNFQFLNQYLEMVEYRFSNGYRQSAQTFAEKINYSMNPTGDVPLGEFAVTYPHVTKYNRRSINGQEHTRGKIISTFKVAKSLISVYNTHHHVNVDINPPHDNFELFLLPPYSSSGHNNAGVNIGVYNRGLRPQLESTTYFNHNGDTVRFEKYEYVNALEHTTPFRGIKIVKKVEMEDHDSQEDYPGLRGLYDSWGGYQVQQRWCFKYAYYYMHSFFAWHPYEIRFGRYLLDRKTVKQYDLEGGNTIRTIEEYEYDENQKLINTTTVNSDGKIYEKQFFYTSRIPNMYLHSIHSVVDETVSYVDGIETSRVKDIYTNKVVPSATQVSFDGGPLTDKYRYTYTVKNSIRELIDPNGNITTYIWSHQGMYPVLEIRNSSYAQIESILGSSAIETLENGIPWTDLQLYNDYYLPLKNQLPKESMVWMYFYRPRVGLTTMVDPRGLVTIYEYDWGGRLLKTGYKTEIGFTNKTIYFEEFDYNYR